MGTGELHALETANTLVMAAQASYEPIVVLDGEDECLVAMRPAVFERILFDSDLLNCEQRESLWF